jgi:hypothetical protein
MKNKNRSIKKLEYIKEKSERSTRERNLDSNFEFLFLLFQKKSIYI